MHDHLDKFHVCRDVDASQTYRIREIKESSQRAFFGSELEIEILNVWSHLILHQFLGVDIVTHVYGKCIAPFAFHSSDL